MATQDNCGYWEWPGRLPLTDIKCQVTNRKYRDWDRSKADSKTPRPGRHKSTRGRTGWSHHWGKQKSLLTAKMSSFKKGN